MNLLDWLGTISGYKTKYERCGENYQKCHRDLRETRYQLAEAQEKIDELELLLPRPPLPKIDYVEAQPAAWVRACLSKFEVVWLQLDADYYLTDQKNFLNVIAWDWVDTWDYVKDRFDCENFAIAFKSHVDRYFYLSQVGIVIDYQAGHAYNLVIFPDGNVMLLEPQGDKLFVWTDKNMFYVLKGAIVLL